MIGMTWYVKPNEPIKLGRGEQMKIEDPECPIQGPIKWFTDSEHMANGQIWLRAEGSKMSTVSAHLKNWLRAEGQI